MTATGPKAINAYGVSIRWQSTDFVSTPTSSTTFTTSATGLPTTSATGLSAASTTTGRVSPTPDAGSGLSTGAKAGIGVGSAIGGLLLIIVGILLFRFFKRKQDVEQDRRPESYLAPPKYGAQELQQDKTRTELESDSHSAPYLRSGRYTGPIELEAERDHS